MVACGLVPGDSRPLLFISRTWSARRLPCRQVNQHTVKLDCFLLTHSVFASLFLMGWLNRVVAGGLLIFSHEEQYLAAVDLHILIYML